MGCADISRDCLMMYFEGKPPANQFLCRAYLCQGQLKSPQSFGSVEEIEKAVIYFLKAIEISKVKPRYHFLVFNASVLYFQMVRPLLRPGPRQHLVPTLTQVVKALEEVGEPDYSWRAQLMLHLVECLVDAGKGEEASSFAKATSNFIESHIPDLYPKIFSLQVRHKLFDFNKNPKKTEASPVLSVIYKMQKLKQIKEIFLLLMHSAAAQSPATAQSSSPCLAESPSPIPPADRVAFLLELAFLALQLKHHQMAADCLRELKTAGVTSVGQCIMMECVQCDLDLQKKQEGWMKDYSKANVEAQLKVIGRLDKVLQSAVREEDAKVMQAVCASQWNACLPLLQHNLRRNVKGALLKVAQVLEDTHSVQLEMRCQVHSELAVIEEEEGRLEPALLHLQRALLLDERGVHHERLTSALNLLQLRGTLYQTPSRTEDQAAMLIQQAPVDLVWLISLLRLSTTLHVVKLWAALAKTARKQEVWDVCRAACRFCLLYDDGRWKAPKSDCERKAGDESPVEGGLHGDGRPSAGRLAQSAEKDLLRLLAEVDWIQDLSAYATSNFLRAAELGAEIREAWVVVNAAVYLWNYNSHLLAAGEQRRLLPTFQRAVELLRQTGHAGEPVLLVMLCDAVAQGLIQPWFVSAAGLGTGQGREDSGGKGELRKKGAGKGAERTGSIHSLTLDHAALQDMRKALELCDYALHLSNGNVPGESVPIAARKQVISTWVWTKRLLQQQIGQKLDIDDECKNEAVSAMTRVLVGVEMLLCNSHPRHIEFSVPSLSTLVRMASDCKWSDPVVELQVWTHLACFSHQAQDHNLVMTCSHNALQLEAAAAQRLKVMAYALYSRSAVEEMLSNAACLRGLSMVHKSNGHPHSYREALQMLQSSVSYAERAGNSVLCMATARHYWNNCLPLTETSLERQQLRQHLEKILKALVHTSKKDPTFYSKLLSCFSGTSPSPNWLLYSMCIIGAVTGEEKGWSTLTVMPSVTSPLEASRALTLLEQAIRDMPRTRHRLARLGESVVMDMQKFRDEGELYCSHMWHRSVKSQWQKVDYLLEFGEWLYCQNFPLADAQHQIQWAIDILLHMITDQEESNEDWFQGKQTERTGEEREFPTREVRRLDSLVRAHTLLAAMGDRASPHHQQNLLRAYSLVSMATAREVIREMMKNPLVPASRPCPSATAKKEKDKEKDKGKKSKEPPPIEEKPKARRPQDDVLPSSPEEWAQFDCPEETQSLFFLDLLVKELQSLSLTHLTLPILHLAEVIAHDLLDRRSLSDLYCLRIVRSCSQLVMETSTVYHEKLLSLTGIHEQEQMECRKAIALQRERNSLYMDYNCKTDNEKSEVDHIRLSGKQCGDLCSQDIWLDKAEICLGMGLYQPARQLLAEAHLVAKELGDQAAVGRSLLSLAVLASKEQNHSQALALLEKAQGMGGDEDFWYKLTLALVTATVAQKGQDTDTKASQIVKQGCVALKLMLEKRRNRGPDLRFLITSLESRGAVERVHAASPVEPSEALSTQSVQNLMAACDTLRETASEFLRLGHREQAAEALLEHAHALRILAKHTDNEGKRRHLLDAYSFMQQAVSAQEHVVLNAQSLFPSQECQPLSLPAMRRLLRVRLALAELSLAMLEQVCAEENRLALAQDRKASVERTIEEFEWISTGRTLGQVALSQLATVNFLSLGCVETRASSLSLMGKCLRLLAMQRDPLYPFTLWDGHNLEEDQSESKASPEEEEEEELTGENGRESSRTEPRHYTAKCAELQRRKRSAQQLLAQASETLAQAISLSLQHKLPSSILSEACLNMLECHGQFDPCATGQYLALLQSCSCTAMMADILRSACTDTRVSQLSTLLNLHRNLLPSQEETPTSLLKGVEDSLNGLSKAYSHLTINPSHLSLLGELPSNLKILLLQHTQDRSTLYGAFYERSKLTESQRGKAMQVSGTLVCTRVAKVAVHPRALLDLRDRTQAFRRETKHNFLKEAHWLGNEGRAGSERHIHPKSNSEEKLESHFKAIVQEMEDYLCPILSQFDFSCFRHQTPSISIPESTRTKEKEEKAGPDKGLAVGSPAELGEYVVLLADWMLMELPLEALAILQEEGLSSVSRDFSLQLLHTRLQREEPVESDNKKETKGGKGAKGKGDQSKAIKMVPVNRVLPPNTLPVDTHNFKCIFSSFGFNNDL
ncbi:unnamed protein product [Coregonus sp. 'balchen']|nr:unnamed protein product [Coregonus sp. 'balchen']